MRTVPKPWDSYDSNYHKPVPLKRTNAFIVLTGAIKNFGDFLIRHRGINLLKHFHPDAKIIEHKRFYSIKPVVDRCNQSRAIILCGGPGYHSDVYPHIFPLTKDLRWIKVPVIPFGLGWYGKPLSAVQDYKKFSFTKESISFLRKVHSQCKYSSCRDVITEKILNNAGFENVLMTGCPVWYDLDCLDMPFKPPAKLDKVIISFPANKNYYKYCFAIYRKLKEMLPESHIICAFHRDIAMKSKVHEIIKKGDFAYIGKGVVAGLKLYRDCDLHVGCRVHGHLLALSWRKPSILIEEDGRGRGMSESLQLPGIWAEDKEAANKAVARVKAEMQSNFSSYIGL